MRLAYADGSRKAARGVSPREQILAPHLLPHGFGTRLRWFEGAMCFELDFAHIDRKLNVEIDGPEHRWPKRVAKDNARDEALAVRGWKILRVANADVDESPERVAERVLVWADSHR